ncbi:hypothetical protein J6590_011037 [Homalodisca vitripennis]|nr:hypothetical protein J6590_011037 [Homalodisca vitripennis]
MKLHRYDESTSRRPTEWPRRILTRRRMYDMERKKHRASTVDQRSIKERPCKLSLTNRSLSGLEGILSIPSRILTRRRMYDMERKKHRASTVDQRSIKERPCKLSLTNRSLSGLEGILSIP